MPFTFGNGTLNFAACTIRQPVPITLHVQQPDLLISLIFDSTTQRLCIRRLTPVKQILRQWRRARLRRPTGFNIRFLLLPYLLLHLYLLMMALLLISIIPLASLVLGTWGVLQGSQFRS